MISSSYLDLRLTFAGFADFFWNRFIELSVVVPLVDSRLAIVMALSPKQRS
jgi:hypothetical protein